jgi:hypothetical protein
VQTCSKCHTQMLDTASKCINCDAELNDWSTTSVTLKRMQENPRVNYVRVSVAHDCCPACRDIEGAYAKDAVPKLPTEGCSHRLGCRCFYQPVLEEIYP